MIELTCIVCPNGCLLKVEGSGDNLSVTGNKCKKGVEFAKEELTCPKRTVCTTMKTVYNELPVVPVRTSQAIPKELIFDMMKTVNCVMIDKKLKRGETVISNILNTGADIIVTSDMTKY
jgi:CxxC motif-containing protein